MIKKFFEKITKLIDVKSIMTLTLTVVFAFLSVKQIIDTQSFMSIFTMIVGFYFGTQTAKKDGGSDE